MKSGSPRWSWFPRTPLERVITGSALLMAAVALVSGLAVWRQSLSEIERAERSRIEAIAAYLAIRIDGEDHEVWSRAFHGMDSLQNWTSAPPSLLRDRELLSQTHDATGLETPIYTLRLRDEVAQQVRRAPGQSHHDAMEFLLTTASEPYWKHRYEYRPEMAPVLFAGRSSASTQSYRDRHGTWLSAYAPIKDAGGGVVGLLEVDAPVDSELLQSQYSITTLLLAVLVCFLGSYVLVLFLLAIMRRRDVENEKLALVASRTDNGIFIADSQGRIEWVNQGFERMTGIEFAQIRGRTVKETLGAKSGKENGAGKLDQCVREGKESKLEFGIESRSGDALWVGVEIQPVFDRLGRLQNSVTILRDLSRAKQTEEMMVQARDDALQASRLKSNFLANISHELRTPLNGILGVNELLLGTDLDHEQEELIDTAQKCGFSLLELINGILDFSQIETGAAELRRVEFDIREVVHELTKEARRRAATKNVHIAHRVAPEVAAWFIGDEVRLRQVISELANNAVKFTESGFVDISVSARSQLPPEPEEASSAKVTPLRPKMPRQEMLIEVQDSGIGIPGDKLESIFQSFTQVDGSSTRSAGGTGLGLTLVQRTVELMNGQIGVRSRSGEGSTFWITLEMEVAAEQPRNLPQSLRR